MFYPLKLGFKGAQTKIGAPCIHLTIGLLVTSNLKCELSYFGCVFDMKFGHCMFGTQNFVAIHAIMQAIKELALAWYVELWW